MIEAEYQEEIIEEEISLDKVYSFPSEIVEREYDNKKLIIYTQGVCWLVLDKREYKVYKDLESGKNIEAVLETYDEDLVGNVLAQIEGKHFEHPVVNTRNAKTIYIYLTNNCNQRCKHCYMYAGDISIEELGVDEWKGVLSDFKDNGGEGVTFTGGEPTVYRGFEEIVRYAHEQELSITILSNGIAWDERKISSISSMIDEIQISLDGYDPQSYHAVRQTDGFEKALATVKAFASRGTRVSIAVTPLFDEIDTFIERFEPLANELLMSYPEIYIKFNLELLNGREVHANYEENRIYRKRMRQLVERLYPKFYEQTFPMNYENNCIMNNCGFGEISIASNGNIYWCNRIHELQSRYNIREIGFKELFEISERIKKVTSVDNSETCEQCEIKYICGGGCRMDYPEIINADDYQGKWQNSCDISTKHNFYRKMITSNEYFYSE